MSLVLQWQFSVEQIGIIFSSLVVALLPDQILLFRQEQAINRSLIGYFPASISA
jgi:hypothetical protein